MKSTCTVDEEAPEMMRRDVAHHHIRILLLLQRVSAACARRVALPIGLFVGRTRAFRRRVETWPGDLARGWSTASLCKGDGQCR